LIFHRVTEPNEQAFTLLIPEGWITEGGIFRVNPTAQGGAGQSIAAKLDFTVKKDRPGTVMLRWLPDVLFFDMSHSPAGQMGLFPPGSNYNGMTVYPLMPAEQFIKQVAFPYAHPSAANVRVLSQKKLPQLARHHLRMARIIQPMIDFSYGAALVDFRYTENGQQYEERMLAVVENWGQAGAGMWGNKETFLIRAPLGQLKRWEPILQEIRTSVIVNQRWLSEEIRGQMIRGGIMNQTLQEMQRIEREITAHRQQVNAEITHDFFLTLTGQEEYVNPFTHQVETGTNQWRFRWENEQGDIIYTDQEDYDPNTDVRLHISGFKRTPIRPRGPGNR
jgi:hypothetical protein